MKDELREAAMKLAWERWENGWTIQDQYDTVWDAGYDAGKPKWIPVSERLPKQTDERQVKCEVTVEWSDGTRDVGYTGYFEKEGWAIEVQKPGDRLKAKVVAWCERREPYQQEGE